jgi:hypothetical protein
LDGFVHGRSFGILALRVRILEGGRIRAFSGGLALIRLKGLHLNFDWHDGVLDERRCRRRRDRTGNRRRWSLRGKAIL